MDLYANNSRIRVKQTIAELEAKVEDLTKQNRTLKSERDELKSNTESGQQTGPPSTKCAEIEARFKSLTQELDATKFERDNLRCTIESGQQIGPPSTQYHYSANNPDFIFASNQMLVMRLPGGINKQPFSRSSVKLHFLIDNGSTVVYTSLDWGRRPVCIDWETQRFTDFQPDVQFLPNFEYLKSLMLQMVAKLNLGEWGEVKSPLGNM